jgi:hypothetical protein
MSVRDVLKVLSTIGTTVATVGNLLSRLGFALSASNLDDGQLELKLDRQVSSQDPPTQGVKDEKPVRRRRNLHT